MLISDRIYGKIEIKDKVIQELILSKPLQRLKKINQHGAPQYIQPIRNVNRFEHSVGVWYLSFLYKRSIEEQIACLLHDVPHTAFSHAIDFVFPSEKHNFHEKFTEKIIINSEIPEILQKNNINLKKVLDVHKFPLLENDLPDISFDRWDYFMRDGTALGFFPKVLVSEFIKNVFEKDNKFYFKDIGLASTYSILFMNFSRLIWLDPTSHGSYFLIAESMKTALQNKIINENDLFSDDEALMKKLKTSKNIKIVNLLKRLKVGKEFRYSEKNKAEFYGPNKPRCVDPLILINDKLKRLSNVVPNIGTYFEEFKTSYKYLGVTQI
ncbi:MAG: HD domain-containing protein [bacterium]|nr:MAG: HD domain-containing protein [bacterium]